jgi:hypothetical protein
MSDLRQLKEKLLTILGFGFRGCTARVGGESGLIAINNRFETSYAILT